jgi:hypothetical protein
MAGAADAAAGRGATGFCAVAGPAAATGAAAVFGAAAAAVFKAGAGEDGGTGAAIGAGLGAPVGPPGGSVGSLMVGAAVGFGGRLMRTVSFFGCTLPVDFFNGSAPVGVPGSGLFGGGMSAIMSCRLSLVKISGAARLSNLIQGKKKPDWRRPIRFCAGKFQ